MEFASNGRASRCATHRGPAPRRPTKVDPMSDLHVFDMRDRELCSCQPDGFLRIDTGEKRFK
jgi:hypothetical protein